MNCKPGDLAYIFRAGSNTQNTIGRIVRVVERGPNAKPLPSLGFDITVCWVVDPQQQTDIGTPVQYVNDCCLRPLRDPGQDEIDETLREQEAA